MATIRRIRPLHFIALSAVALAACGGGSSADSKLATAVKEAVISAAAASDSAFEVSDDEGKCIADKVLEDETAAAALDEANTAGKTGQDMLDVIDSDNPVFAKTVFLCLSVEKIVEAFSSGMTADGKLTDEQTTCLVAAFKKVDKNDLADALATGGSQTTDTTDSNAKAVLEQLTADISACTGVPAG